MNLQASYGLEIGPQRGRLSGPAACEEGEDMQETSSIQARLLDASTLPETLAVSFDSFEAIRLAAAAAWTGSQNCSRRS